MLPTLDKKMHWMLDLFYIISFMIQNFRYFPTWNIKCHDIFILYFIYSYTYNIILDFFFILFKFIYNFFSSKFFLVDKGKEIITRFYNIKII